MNENSGMNTPWSSLLERIICGLASQPDKVAFKVQRLQHAVLVTITPVLNDCRRILGRKGQTIQAAQLLFATIGAKHGDNIRLTIRDGNGVKLPDASFEPCENWTRDNELKQLVEDIGSHLFEKEFVTSAVSHGVETHLTLDGKYNPPLDPLVADAIGKLAKNIGGAWGRSVHFHYKETN